MPPASAKRVMMIIVFFLDVVIAEIRRLEGKWIS